MAHDGPMPDLRRVANPPSPFESRRIEWEGEAPEVELEIYEERAKSIVAENDSPDLGFRYSVNPYRGCFHGCVYCYARPGHQYLGFGAGTDFERKIVVKVNAAELLERELRRGKCRGEALAFSGVTDCYQPLEASYGLTRSCLEVCLAHGQRVGIVTKGTAIRRDADLLAALRARVFVSIAFADDEMRRGFDPFAPPIDARFETMRRLAEAGVRVGVALAPIVPGVNDSMIPEILERAHAAGARRSFMTLLRLPAEVREVFDVSLEAIVPGRAGKVRSAIREMRGGRMNDPRFGHRMRGSGARWHTIEQLYGTWVKRLGLDEEDDEQEELPPPKGQLSLF
jgi:DNA repair photolyase